MNNSGLDIDFLYFYLYNLNKGFLKHLGGTFYFGNQRKRLRS